MAIKREETVTVSYKLIKDLVAAVEKKTGQKILYVTGHIEPQKKKTACEVCGHENQEICNDCQATGIAYI